MRTVDRGTDQGWDSGMDSSKKEAACTEKTR